MNLTLFDYPCSAGAAVLPGPILFYMVGKGGVRVRTLPGGSPFTP